MLVFQLNTRFQLDIPGRNSDYQTWHAHESNSALSLRDNCMLGAKRSFLRRKKGSVCLNGNQLVSVQTSEKCQCQAKYDFLW